MALKLEYGFTSNPYPIRASVAGSAPNTIDLSIMISQRDQAVTVKSIAIQIPMGGAVTDDFALSTAKELPQPIYNQNSHWSIAVQGGTVTIGPSPGSSGMLTTPIEFVLPGIAVNNAEGFVPIRITEAAPLTMIDEFSYRLEKLAADFPVARFYAIDPVLDDLDLSTSLHWECSAQGKEYSYRLHTADGSADQGYGWMPKECLHSGDCYTCNDGTAGIQTPQLADDTTFALDVIKADASGARVVDKTLFVTVRVQVPYFSPAARLLRMLGSFVVLRWRAFNASHVTVRLNDDIVDGNAPADTYVNGYLVNLPLVTEAYHVHFHLTAHARTGSAVAYYAAYPDLTIQYPSQIQVPNRFPNDDNPFNQQPNTVKPTLVSAAASSCVAVVGCQDQGARVLDLNLRKLRDFGQNDLSSISYLQAVAMSPDGKQLIIGGQGVQGFDASNGKQLWAIGNNCDRLVMSADGSLLLVIYANYVGAVDMKNPGLGTRPVQNPYPGFPPGQAGQMLTAAVSGDGTSGILGMMSGYQAPLPYLTVLNLPQFNSDPRTISIAGYRLVQVAMSASGKLALATAYKDDGTAVVLFIDVPNRTVTDAITIDRYSFFRPALPQRILPIAFDPAGMALGDSYAFIQVGGNNPPYGQGDPVEGVAIVLDLAQKKILTTFDTGPNATGLALGPDNSSLVTINDNGVSII